MLVIEHMLRAAGPLAPAVAAGAAAAGIGTAGADGCGAGGRARAALAGDPAALHIVAAPARARAVGCHHPPGRLPLRHAAPSQAPL